MTRCPHCNRPLTVRLDTAGDAAGNIDGFEPVPGGWRRRQTLASHSHLNAAIRSAALGEDGPLAREANYEKVTPVGRLEPRDVATSLLDAAVTFGFAGAGLGGLLWYFESPYIFYPALASGFASAVFRYYGGIGLAQSLLQTVESVTRRDLNHDGHIGPRPEQSEVRTVRVELKEESGQGARYQFATLGLEPDKLHALAVAINRGDSFSERTASRYGITQDEFRSLRDDFIERGWAQWKHSTRKQQGVELTRGGGFILRTIQEDLSPSPTAGYQAANARHARTQQHAARNSSSAGGVILSL